MKILLSDDHDCVRWGVKGILNRSFQGLTFGEAANSRETLNLFYQCDWDCVVLDIDMPGRTGLDLLDEFKKSKPDIPIVILSGLAELDFGVRAIKSGADGYLSKTLVHTEIVTAINRVLDGKKYISSDLAGELASMLHDRSDKPRHEALSNRELQVMRMIVSGKRNGEIAAELSLSEQSVSTYRSRLLLKLGLRNDAEIIHYAIEHKLAKV